MLAYGIGYALAGWGIAVVAGGGYVAWVLQRGRRASQQVSPSKRRWSS